MREGAHHWFLAHINMQNVTVNLMDSLASEMHKTSQRRVCTEMLKTLDQLFALLKPKNLKFENFIITMVKENFPQEHNGFDCGVYSMKYMEFIFLGKDHVDEFDQEDAQLELATRITSNASNEY
ncbi:putative ubiquitin-like-specific protease 1B [Humulus lupulus]|uniref:putative ubiquitin-like-specific protease 1B n=1 Tax=Humulus lupulus TaxID=3486 RepID=UPI002B40E120|nr:putative ubiquitin-like-specific protease 1B [Humulus lupulus]